MAVLLSLVDWIYHNIAKEANDSDESFSQIVVQKRTTEEGPVDQLKITMKRFAIRKLDPMFDEDRSCRKSSGLSSITLGQKS